ncbi:MAG: ATP-binding cassette domain-containing protein [Deltaproteobacteria bacterium]|nr:ATP-binding cassette domain-containing protein [Deltaproteobacteria bacterium]
MVRLEDIGVVRRNPRGQEVAILAGISFEAPRGEITVIIGPSGSGKSSLIRLVNRLVEPSAGRILLDGEDIASVDPLALRRRVGMVLQKPFLFEGTVLGNLQRPFLYRQEPPPPADSPEVLRSIELAGLAPDFLERDARTLSGGEQQRVNLARALISRPQVLLLDEPTSALDRPTSDRLAATLRDICRAEQPAVIMVTHDLRLCERVADHLIYMERGRMMEEGRAPSMLERPRTDAFRRFLAEPEKGKE